MMIQQLYPETHLTKSVSVDTYAAYDFQTAQPNVAELASHVAAILTGLSSKTLVDVVCGFRIVSSDEKREVVACLCP